MSHTLNIIYWQTFAATPQVDSRTGSRSRVPVARVPAAGTKTVQGLRGGALPSARVVCDTTQQQGWAFFPISCYFAENSILS